MGRLNNDLLNHERIHFRITKAIVKEYAAKIDQLKETGSGSTEKEAQTDAVKRLQVQVTNLESEALKKIRDENKKI